MNLPKITKRFETSLASALSAAGSTFTLESATDEDGNALSGLYGLTIDVGNSNVEDLVVTISGTTATVVYRGIDADDPVTEVSGNKKAHRRGAPVVITDYPVLAFIRNMLAGESGYTLPAMLRYASGVGNPSNSDDLVRKAYVDGLVLGTLSTINIIVPGKAGETVADGNLVYFDETDNEWKKCDADTAATVNNTLLGIAQGAGTDGNAITNGVLLQGVDDAQSGLTEGDVQYASNTAGGISASAGTTEVTIGIAKSATELYFNPRFNQQLTEDQQDALTGTSGTPSNSNKFVTDADTAENTASKLVRRKSDSNVTVPTTPTASTDAASKSYVDAAINDKDEYPNTHAAVLSHFSTILIPDADLGWTISVTGGSATNRGNGVEMIGSTHAYAAIRLGGHPTNENGTLTWNQSIDHRLAYVFTPDAVSNGSNPADGTDKWYFHGFCEDSTNASEAGDITVTNKVRAGFAHYNGKIYTVTCSGSAVTTNEVDASDDGAVKKIYTIEHLNGNSVKFYINGVLVATHTTNLPTGTAAVGLLFGGYNYAGSNAGAWISNINLSESLS